MCQLALFSIVNFKALIFYLLMIICAKVGDNSEWCYNRWVQKPESKWWCISESITLCTPKERQLFPLPLPPSQQGSTPLSLILLSILSVSLLHLLWRHDLSYLAVKGEELRIKKTRPILLQVLRSILRSFYNVQLYVYLWFVKRASVCLWRHNKNIFLW